MSAYESKYGLKSDEFYQQFRAGKMGDDMDFVEWSVFCDMREATQRRLNHLVEQVP